MTLREIGLLTIAKLGHDYHQLEPVELRESKRQLAEGTALFRRYREIDDRPCLPMVQTIAASCEMIGTISAPSKYHAGGFHPNYSL
ncbi:hypothetical protein [Citrobacter sp. AATXQ]|uniref:hypothetical protein n=1 Tax=Citrobacter sp. AATXQ TaxID=1779184 RepID=UPI000AC4383F|nr:hypothetical protein [Citrobacter sp. AATXQ]